MTKPVCARAAALSICLIGQQRPACCRRHCFNNGLVCAIRRDPETGWLHAGADPRREAYAIVW